MAEQRKFVIGRIFNNNVILVHDIPKNQEFILLGKGIGFGQKVDGEIDRDDSRIEKKFRLEQEQHLKQYESMINQVDQAVIGISEEIISLITQEISPDINEHVHVALPDHINFAIHRLRNGLEIVNPFLLEIQTLFAKEYALAQRAAKMIEEQFQIDVPESEVGFLTLHIHSAVSYIPVAKAVQVTNMISDLVSKVEQSIGRRLDKDSVEYVRFILHLRHAIERIRNQTSISNPLLDQIKITMPESFALATQLGKHIAEKLEIHVSEEESAYTALHIFRLSQQLERNQE